LYDLPFCNDVIESSETKNIVSVLALFGKRFQHGVQGTDVKNAIAIFARAPVPGQVKTRLARHVGEAGAAQLYTAMLRDTIAVAIRAAHSLEACEVVLAYTPEAAFSPGEYSLLSFWSGTRFVQSDGDLGARMLDCILRLQEQGRAARCAHRFGHAALATERHPQRLRCAGAT
jgi:hypothetical protein